MDIIYTYIYHDDINKMLVVNKESKLFYITSDENIIKMFSSKYAQVNVISLSHMAAMDMIKGLSLQDYKQLF